MLAAFALTLYVFIIVLLNIVHCGDSDSINLSIVDSDLFGKSDRIVKKRSEPDG